MLFLLLIGFLHHNNFIVSNPGLELVAAFQNTQGAVMVLNPCSLNSTLRVALVSNLGWCGGRKGKRGGMDWEV